MATTEAAAAGAGTHGTTGRSLEAVQRLQAERNRMVEELSSLSDEECRLPATWANTPRTVQFMLRTFSLHELDHQQHLQRLLRARGVHLSQAQLLLAKAQALRGELEAMVLSLPDEEFEATGPNEGDWSAHQLVDHMIEVDQRYGSEIKRALATNRAPVG